MLKFEDDAIAAGYSRVCGVDEVGRGPYAGPVVAAAVILPDHRDLPFLDDSKKLTVARREEINAQLHAMDDVRISIIELSHEEVDELNILQATWKAMRLAVEALLPDADYILVDGNPVKGLPLPSSNIVKGDSKSASIAAASIVAKVYRDQIMKEADKLYPEYGFASNMGYGTKAHREALEKFGPCPIHRKSFAPIAELLGLPTAKEKRLLKKSKKKPSDPNQMCFDL